MKRRALVIGGSLGGLFAANLLRMIGWDVTVFERARGNLAGRGAGLGSREELFSIMRRVGAEVSASVGADVHSRLCVERDGRVIHEVDVKTLSTAWDRVYAPLRAILPEAHYRQGMSFERYEQHGDVIVAHFRDGSRAEADLLVAADGLASTVRAQAMPEARPAYSGYVAWRFVVTEDDIPRALHEQVFRHMIFCVPQGELAFGIPMPPPEDSTGRARRRAQCVWFREARFEDELPALCTDASGKRHGLSIPPPLIRRDVLDEQRRVAAEILSPQLRAFVDGAKEPILQPVYDLVSARMVAGRVALVGDASSVVRPHVAAGVTKAALDAQALADLLDAHDDIDAALAIYDRERPPFGARLVERGRWLGASIGRGKLAIEPDATPGKRLDALLRGYGAGGIIDGEPVL